ncbi:WxL domain-containing protein [Lacticaseibacillus paracasei]|uniref:WxL domain-containing protein n=1 Tax=Lacticaseibacillus paracasei TaxID=1597 RepID=UPI0021C2FA5A|nr:WxL domain-containing protein [Lacticaseibacillus paracasei]MCP9311041.1 WxL domain-containing protein [Lacticaseibacillus paracasei]MCP9347876.1 WxL domain-containing protein [Lacticaseibacillus paracasei]MCP9367464.1 WxL domain-containing protein [Lacticaseibacillus paracasei]MCP9379671.1 WxL domain-containing protein [Lacticaseibacillus paracasei]
MSQESAYIHFLGGTLLATTLATPVVADTNAGPGNATTNLSGNTTVSAGQPVFTATADQSASAKSTAQFTVDAGQLTLVAVPDLNFGAAKPATIVNGGSQSLVSNTVDNGSSKGQSAFDGNNAGKLIVSDMRGTGKGWSLSTSMDSEFASGASKLKGLSMNLAATGSNSFFGSNKALNLAGTNISDTSTSVVSTNADNSGVGDTTFNLNASSSASLNFPTATNSIFTAGAPYQSDVTWTLVAAQ